MKKKTLLSLLCTLISLSLSAETVKVLTNEGQSVCEVEFYSPEIVRIVKYPSQFHDRPKLLNLVVTMKHETVKLKKNDSDNDMSICSSVLCVHVNKSTGNVRFAKGDEELLKEKECSMTLRPDGADKGSYKVSQTFLLNSDEPIYGLGTIQDGLLNRRNTHVFMEQSNLQDYQNVLQSVRGWGLLWDNYSRSNFDDDSNGMKFSSEVGDCIDYYFIYGGGIDQTVREIRKLTGKVPMSPLWTYGYWQSRERYKSCKELLDVVHKYRELQVPLDGIVQDWQYWGNNYQWNAMEFIGDGFDDAQKMIDEVHNQNAHLMLTIWSSFGPATKQYKQLKEKGLLFDFKTWPLSGLPTWPPRRDYPSGVRCYDVYSDEARDIYWNNLLRLYKMGVDAWWMDSTDPDYIESQDSDYEHITGLGSWRKVRNAFSLCAVKGVYEHQRAMADNNKRVFIMSRSAFAGQQRYQGGFWSGDVASSWTMLRNQIPLGLNFVVTGNPNFNTDIGGFFANAYNKTNLDGTGARNPQYQELYVRWMQYALFNPIFRSHGTEVPREIYYFGQKGEQAYDAIERCIRFRYSLLPYIYSLAHDVTSDDYSYMRPLASDFSSDKKVWNMTDEFMFGKSMLVAPIVKAQYTKEKVMKLNEMSGWDKKDNAERNVFPSVDFSTPKPTIKYLPQGTKWYDFFSGKMYEGGSDVSLSTTLLDFPLFVREGSIIPIAPVSQYADMKSWGDITLYVYPGKDASFTLYEDEGDNYNYEKGEYSTITFNWHDAKHKLSIDTRKGSFKSMLKSRIFRIVVVKDGKSFKDATATKFDKVVKYDGKKVLVNLNE